VTLGPKGRNVVLDKSFRRAPASPRTASPSPRKSSFEDKFENMGAQMVREVASKSADAAGDGTTTATGACGCDRQGRRQVGCRRHEPDGSEKRGIDMAVDAVVADLVKNSKKVTSNEKSRK